MTLTPDPSPVQRERGGVDQEMTLTPIPSPVQRERGAGIERKANMELERLFPDGDVAYVPRFGDERARAQDPAYPAVVFHLRPMTVAQYERAAQWVRRVDDESGETRFAIEPEREAEVLSRHVARIENLRFADGATVADGAAFARAREEVTSALAPLYLEVLAAIRDISVLREGERKN